MSPRRGQTTALLSVHPADLASHGSVVVGMDHTGDTNHLDLGDGQLAPAVIEQASAETMAIGSRDMRFVLSRLGSLRGVGRLDVDRIGAFYGTIAEFRNRTRGPSPLAYFPEGAHHSFADNVRPVPQLGLDPVESDVGTADPAVAIERQNALLKHFFGRYIKG